MNKEEKDAAVLDILSMLHEASMRGPLRDIHPKALPSKFRRRLKKAIRGFHLGEVGAIPMKKVPNYEAAVRWLNQKGFKCIKHKDLELQFFRVEPSESTKRKAERSLIYMASNGFKGVTLHDPEMDQEEVEKLKLWLQYRGLKVYTHDPDGLWEEEGLEVTWGSHPEL